MDIRPYGRSCFRDSIIENFGTSYKLYDYRHELEARASVSKKQAEDKARQRTMNLTKHKRYFQILKNP